MLNHHGCSFDQFKQNLSGQRQDMSYIQQMLVLNIARRIVQDEPKQKNVEVEAWKRSQTRGD